MATRIVFTPDPDIPYVKEIPVEFKWYPGFSITQKQKSIQALHAAAKFLGIDPILEISTKSPEPLGVSLSAFNLKISTSSGHILVECAFQGSKVFEHGGPYTNLYTASSREAKADGRLRTSGKLIGFHFLGADFPTKPLTAFYDWLYLTALWQNKDLADRLLPYRGFTDIEFNPERSINCQARSAALYVALRNKPTIDIDRAIKDKDYFLSLVLSGSKNDSRSKSHPRQLKLSL